MESIDLFIKLNEESEKYLEENYNNLYTRNLYIYAQKANQLSGCTPLEKIDIEEPYIDLLEGIELVCHYLKGLNPILEKSFMTMFTNGQLEINYTDEDIWLEEKTKGSWCCNKNNKKILEDRKDISIHTVPLSLINIDNKKTSFPLLAKIIHEFFHTLIAKDKNGNRTTVKAVAITEMISIYYEFDFVKKMIEKGYSKNNFLNCYYERYNNTTDKIELDRFLNQTILLYKKKTEGVLDGTSYKTGNVTISKEDFEDLYKKINIFFEKEEEKPLYTAHKFAPYIIGAPLAYHLSCSPDPLMVQKMLDFVEEINTLPVSESLSKIGLTLPEILMLNYGNIMENMRQEIIEIEKSTNNCKEKSFSKI